jgi:hypothetical protein
MAHSAVLSAQTRVLAASGSVSNRRTLSECRITMSLFISFAFQVCQPVRRSNHPLPCRNHAWIVSVLRSVDDRPMSLRVRRVRRAILKSSDCVIGSIPLKCLYKYELEALILPHLSRYLNGRIGARSKSGAPSYLLGKKTTLAK